MVILRGLGAEQSIDVAERAWDAGVTLLELPIQTPVDLDALAAVALAGRARGLDVGAGTVVTDEQVRQAKEAGAAFTVSPGVDERIIEASVEAGLPTLPGVATASDIQRCLRLGLRWLKAFPASMLTPEWIRAMQGPFPDLRFVATGGMTPANAPEFLAAGARVAAISLAPAREDQWVGLSGLASAGG
jgi:Entner-Doudoroff aldolase